MKFGNKSIFLLLSMIILLILAVFATNCSPGLIPGENPYDTDSGITENDGYEPDNTPSNASYITTDGSGQERHIFNSDGVYDVDYVKFDAVQDGTYRINLYSIKSFEPELTLYDTDATTILEMKNTGTYTDEYDWWGYDVNHNYSEEEKESIIFDAPEDGTYYFSVKDIYGAHGRGVYWVRVFSVIEIGEINNLTATADPQNFQINLTWGTLSGVDGYYLYRSTSLTDPIDYDNDFVLIRTLSENSFSDTTINPNQTYYYYVRGYVGSNTGNPSNVDDATFEWSEFKPTSSLINASEGVVGQIDITLEYKYNNPNIVEYRLWRADSVDTLPQDYTSVGTWASDIVIGSPEATIHDMDVVATEGSPPQQKYYYYCIDIGIDIGGGTVYSQYSYFDSGAAGE